MLKAIQPDSSATIVWHLDPAVEPMTDEQVVEFHTANRRSPTEGRALLTIRDGAAPTEFVIGVIPPGDLARIESDSLWGLPDWRMQEMYWKCFLAGVRDITNGPFGPVKKIEKNGIEYVDPEWLASKFVRGLRNCGNYLGRLVWSFNTATDDDIKN